MAAMIGLAAGLVACDEPEPEPTCVDWLRCYVDCRDGQHARGDNDVVDKEILLELCEAECLPIAEQVDEVYGDLYLALDEPQDVGFFWDRLSYCLNGDV